jgi:hypothetical protein
MTKVINIKDGMSVWEFQQEMLRLGIQNNERFNIKMKVKKRNKFRSFRAFISQGFCECCAIYIRLNLRKGKHVVSFDTHFGPSWVSFGSIGNI